MAQRVMVESSATVRSPAAGVSQPEDSWGVIAKVASPAVGWRHSTRTQPVRSWAMSR